MDILKLIRDQLDQIPPEYKNKIKVKPVITHIERAQYFLDIAKSLRDDHFYTDVIYRVNQAFEGILKEAYIFLAEKDADNKKTYQIENYLLKNKILNQRVSDLFKNYRQNWRNPSTHDYNLSFSEDEAFMAVVSVSAFVKILLNQITAKMVYKVEKSEIETGKSLPIILRRDYKKLSLEQQVSSMLVSFVRYVKKARKDLLDNHIKFHAGIAAYMKAVDPSLEILSDMQSPEPKIRLKTRPNFFISKNNKHLILEAKLGYKKTYVDDAGFRLFTYLTSLKSKIGILYFADLDRENYMAIREIRNIDNEEYVIIKIVPRET